MQISLCLSIAIRMFIESLSQCNNNNSRIRFVIPEKDTRVCILFLLLFDNNETIAICTGVGLFMYVQSI